MATGPLADEDDAALELGLEPELHPAEARHDRNAGCGSHAKASAKYHQSSCVHSVGPALSAFALRLSGRPPGHVPGK